VVSVVMKKFPEDLKKFIDSENWVFAKTYASTWPHHYIVRKNVDEKLGTVKNFV